MDCIEVLLISRGVEGSPFVVSEQTLIGLPEGELGFYTFLEMLKLENRENCCQIMSTRRHGDFINVCFARDFVEVDTLGRYNRPIMDKRDIPEILRKQVVLACNKDTTFPRLESCGNEQGAACHAVNSI